MHSSAQHVPKEVRLHDATCQKLEFYLRILFAVQPLHPAASQRAKVRLTAQSKDGLCEVDDRSIPCSRRGWRRA